MPAGYRRPRGTDVAVVVKLGLASSGKSAVYIHNAASLSSPLRPQAALPLFL
jgi:hypothetical protein